MGLTQPAIKTYFKLPSNKKNSSERFVRNFNVKLFISGIIKKIYIICSSKHLILFCNVTFSDRRKSISINSGLSDIIGVLDEHCVISAFMGVSNMLNLGATADAYNNFGVGCGNI